jgi:hypothetical protein
VAVRCSRRRHGDRDPLPEPRPVGGCDGIETVIADQIAAVAWKGLSTASGFDPYVHAFAHTHDQTGLKISARMATAPAERSSIPGVSRQCLPAALGTGQSTCHCGQ